MPATGDKRRILFVDDEQPVLDGIRRALRGQRQEWEVRLSGSAKDALAQLAGMPFDAVVADIRMPEMTGDELLVKVRDQYPETVRLVLSAQTDPAVLGRCVGVAHQCLSKPCTTEVLRQTVRRSIRMEVRGASKVVRELVGRMDRLPTIPAVYARMQEVLRDPDSTVEEVGAVVERDAGLSAKLLQLVNSAFFGLSRPIASPAVAVAYLGIETIKSLVMSMGVFSQYEGTKGGGVDFSEEWRHGMATADLARKLIRHHGGSTALADEAFSAGLLHDAGRLVLASNRPVEYERVQAKIQADSVTTIVAEEAVFGCNHADVGGYLFGLWGLPPAVVEAIASHHTPHLADEIGFTPLAAVHVANMLDRDSNAVRERRGRVGWDMPFLEAQGLASHIPEWESLREEWLSGP